jgi:fluoroquinolone resistance protein
LKDCSFQPCRFANCNFVEARFDDCIFFSAERKEGCTFAFGEMRNLELAHCNLSSAVFDRCDLYNLNAKDCSFRSARLKGSVFHKKVSRSVVLTKARFENCNLSFADMCGLSLHSCEFPGCKFSETLLFDADLSDALLENAVIDRAEWDRAKLAGADLRGASISGLNLALLADYRGMMVSESQQDGLLEALGIKVWPG